MLTAAVNEPAAADGGVVRVFECLFSWDQPEQDRTETRKKLKRALDELMNRGTDQAGMITEVADRRPECNQSLTTATLLQRIDRRLICGRRQRPTRTHAYRSTSASSLRRRCRRRAVVGLRLEGIAPDAHLDAGLLSASVSPSVCR